jgi:DNA-binding NarL/FixJ family response regulator
MKEESTQTMLNRLDIHAAPSMQETERERLTHELYDNAVQTLVALVTDMECFRTHRHFAYGETQQEVAAKVEKWKELAQESLGLVSATRAVYNGEQTPTHDAASRIVQLLDRKKTDKDLSHDGLTAREMETLILVARGRVAKEIARSLAISEKTVRNHISNIYRKLDLYDRSQVVIYAMKKGLIDLNDV